MAYHTIVDTSIKDSVFNSFCLSVQMIIRHASIHLKRTQRSKVNFRSQKHSFEAK